MQPAVFVLLVQQVVGISVGFNACSVFMFPYRECHRFGGSIFGQEVVSVSRIGVLRVYESVSRTFPRDGAVGIEQHVACASVQRHLFQVVNAMLDVAFGHHLSAVAVQAHVSRIGESHGTQVGMGNPVYARFLDSNLHPSALCQC